MKHLLIASLFSLNVISQAFSMQEPREPRTRTDSQTESADRTLAESKLASGESYKKEFQPEKLREKQMLNQIQKETNEVPSSNLQMSKRSEPRVFGKAGL